MFASRSPRTYATAFPLTETPIAEGGRWVNGLTNGVGWQDIITTGGRAYGTQTVHAHPPYDDSLAFWVPPDRGQWRDMEIEATVSIGDRSAWTGFHELELHMRNNSSGANNWTGYEVLYSVNSGTTYTEIARYEGPAGGTYNPSGTGTSVTSLTGGAVFNLVIADGDQIRATMIGAVITQYHRPAGTTVWNQMNQVTDATWTAGYPGLGHWNNGNGNNSDYALSAWRARRLS